MINYQQEMLQTIIVIIILSLLRILFRFFLKKFSIVKAIDVNRRKVILNLTSLLVYIFAGVIIAAIWGVEFKQLIIFMSSIIAILGVGFIAQWSILSNLTASVILFFNHPMRIGDRIRVFEKDYNFVGEVKDITGFFVFMRTDNGENITLPTSFVLQRGIEILEKER